MTHFRHWKRALFALRGCIFLVFAFDLAIWSYLFPPPPQSVPKWTYLPWFLYRLGYYLFFEYLWHHYALWRARLVHIFTLILALFLCSIILDLVGNTFNLFSRLWWYDRMIHLTALPWALAALFWLFSHIFAEKHHLTHLFWFIPYNMISGLTLATVIHEIIEYSIDLITHSQMGTAAGNDIYDTARDMALNMIGGLAFTATYVIYEKAKAR